MSDRLPARWPDDRPPRQVARAARAQEGAELAIYEHQLAARYDAECDAIDSRAAGDATLSALKTEFEVLDWGQQAAGSSAARKELVAQKVSQLSAINLRRIARRFGE